MSKCSSSLRFLGHAWRIRQSGSQYACNSGTDPLASASKERLVRADANLDNDEAGHLYRSYTVESMHPGRRLLIIGMR
ncbi:hypothetical protein BD414DRAFT_489768 [Trametes punicea]|nr:hypothetical protein BD414DRAFT_489768 [Trametes punicea]